ncbi:hypothetical protein ACU686_38480 [Yinghuangia aomiensis]
MTIDAPDPDDSPATAEVPAPASTLDPVEGSGSSASPVPAPRSAAGPGGSPESSDVPDSSAEDFPAGSPPADEELRFVSSFADTDAVLNKVTTRAMATRLPRLIGTALRLVWDVDRRRPARAPRLPGRRGRAGSRRAARHHRHHHRGHRLRRRARPAPRRRTVAVPARGGRRRPRRIGVAVVYLSQRLTPQINRKAGRCSWKPSRRPSWRRTTTGCRRIRRRRPGRASRCAPSSPTPRT